MMVPLMSRSLCFTGCPWAIVIRPSQEPRFFSKLLSEDCVLILSLARRTLTYL